MPEPIWFTEPKFCLNCGEQIVPTYPMAQTRWRSGRVKFCSRPCVSQHTHKGVKRGPPSAAHRAANSAAKARRAQGGKRSSLEITIEGLLLKNDIQFMSQKQIGNHCVDFLVPPKLVIECDGSYWHSLPEQVERDAQNDIMLTRLGYAILRLGEREIRNEPERCGQMILAMREAQHVPAMG